MKVFIIFEMIWFECVGDLDIMEILVVLEEVCVVIDWLFLWYFRIDSVVGLYRGFCFKLNIWC